MFNSDRFVIQSDDNSHTENMVKLVITDIISRYYKIQGKEVNFITAAFENNVKILKDLCCEVKEFYGRCVQDIYISSNSSSNSKNETDIEPEYIDQNAYFFCFSKYRQKIKEYIEEHEDFILPKHKKEEVLERLNNLNDLPITCNNSGTNIVGISVPNNPYYIFYDWFVSLISYSFENNHDLQVINIDDSIVWLSMLLSAGYELPRQIYVSNLYFPVNYDLISSGKYDNDIIRYYLISRLDYESDIKFSEEEMIKVHDNELLGVFGNCVNRIFGMIYKYSRRIKGKSNPLFDVSKLNGMMNEIKLQNYLSEVMSLVRILNEYINETHIWTINLTLLNQSTDNNIDLRTEDDRNNILKSLLEGLYIVAHYLYPIIPTSCEKVFKFIGIPMIKYDELNWNNIPDNHLIMKHETKLFTYIDKK